MTNQPSPSRVWIWILSSVFVIALFVFLLRQGAEQTKPPKDPEPAEVAQSEPEAAVGPAEPASATPAAPPLPFPEGHPMERRVVIGFAESRMPDGSRSRVWVTATPEDPREFLRVEETTDANGIAGVEVVVADRVLFGAPDPESQEMLEELMARHGYVVTKQLRFQPTRIIHLGEPTVEAVPEALQRLAAALQSPEAFVEADHVHFPIETIPDDPKWDAEMWSLRQIDAPLAWDLTTGSEDVIVAVQDTKLTVTHPDLQDNVWVNPREIPGNGIDDDHNGYIDDLYGWNVHSNSPDLLYNVVNNHGEHVAGTVAAVGNNGEGVVGVNWNSKIMFFSVSDSLSTTETAEAIEYTVWIKRNQGLNIVSHNCSFGSLYTNSTYAGSSTRRNAIALGRDEGILFTAAAGNDGKALEGTSDLDGNGTWYNHYPSSNTVENFPTAGDWEAMVAVAASGSGDSKASFSNYNLAGYGTVVDIAAPGVSIHSTVDASGYSDKNGTSMASPHVAGAHGLVASANPSLGARAIRDIVYAGVESVGAWTDTKTNAQGRLNLYNSVLAAKNLPQAKLLSPAVGSFIPSGHAVPLMAGADDGDGTVTSVAFHAIGSDGADTFIGTDTDGSDGWNHLWTNPPADQYTLYAVATDNGGNSTVPDLGVVRVSVGGYYRDENEQWPLAADGIWSIQDTYSSALYTGSFFGKSVAYNYVSSGEEAAYTFHLKPQFSGSWEVFFRWPSRNSNGSAVPIELLHDGGTYSTTIDMSRSQDGYQFNSLGAFTFTAGTSYTLKVLTTGLSSEYAAADAVRMDYQSSVSTPIVSVTANDPSGSEVGPDGGEYTFTRTLATGSLTVHYTMGGTATAGSDYTTLSGSITLADGEFVKTLLLDVLDDTAIEDPETAVLTIAPDAAYTLAATGSSASVSISSEDVNMPPVVAITSPSADVVVPLQTNRLFIEASVGDDGQPAWGTLAQAWSQVGGPAGQSVVFNDPSAAATFVAFPGEGTYVLRFTADDGLSAVSTDLRVIVGAPGAPVPGTGVRREFFSGISGTLVSNLTSAAKFINNQPDSITILDTLFESPGGVGDNYGQRVRGYFIPPQSGDHVFWIASDDSSELWLSTDEEPANKVKIAYVSGYTSSRQWDKYPDTQDSAPVSLLAGQPYFIEALQKEGSGGDNLAVGVTFPDASEEKPVTATHLATFEDVPGNAAPEVHPGPSLSGTVGAAIPVDATVEDDGNPYPPGSVTTEWIQVSGPGTATFANPGSVDTSVVADTAGTYVLRLTADDGGAQTFEEITLEAAPMTPAEEWRYLHFGQVENTGDAADGHDFDGDGLVNLLERAFGTTPTDPNNRYMAIESVVVEGGSAYMAITYRQRMGGTGTIGVDYAADGISYVVQYDNDLTDPWSEGGVTIVEVLDDTPDPGIQTVTIRLTTPASPTQPQFIRLKVTGE
ncbi:MAG: S8 family serine peptidase [Oceanipulchritudo sp.]